MAELTAEQVGRELDALRVEWGSLRSELIQVALRRRALIRAGVPLLGSREVGRRLGVTRQAVEKIYKVRN